MLSPVLKVFPSQGLFLCLVPGQSIVFSLFTPSLRMVTGHHRYSEEPKCVSVRLNSAHIPGDLFMNT